MSFLRNLFSFKTIASKATIPDISQKRTVLVLFVLVGIIMLNEPITQFLTGYIVTPVLSKISSSFAKDILVLFLALGITTTLFVRRDYIPNLKILCFSFFVSSTYCYFRFWDKSTWIFTPTFSIGFLKYADIFLLTGAISVANCIRLFVLHCKSRIQGKSVFFTDYPIKHIIDDRYFYQKYAREIAENINGSVTANSFAIGIAAKWGSGKTSFLNLIENSLDSSIIKVNFNAWRSTNAKSIIQDFFKTVKEALEPHNSQLSILLSNYGEKIIAFDEGKLSKGGKVIFSLIDEDSSLETLFGQINETLKILNKKIVVFIDDVDRLDKEEIFEVLRLVRNTANFYNAFFIVAYDRNYVLHVLKNIGVFQYEYFLEKIFQVEVTLPYFDVKVIANKLIENLTRIFPNKGELELRNSIAQGEDGQIPILSWIETIRDVTRLSNAILLNARKIEEDIDLLDFIQIEILRMKYPAVYIALFKKVDLFFETAYSRNRDADMLVLSKCEDNTSSTTVLERYIRENTSELLVNENSDIAKIIHFVGGIFNDSPTISFVKNYIGYSHLSITNPDRFNLYFAYGLLPGLLSENEYLATFQKSLEDIKSQILIWVEDGKEQKLISRIKASGEKEFPTVTLFENAMKAIVFLANQKSKFGNGHQDVGYDINDFFEKIMPSSKMIKRYYTNRSADYKDFVNSIFYSQSSSFFYEAQFLKHISAYSTNEQLQMETFYSNEEIEACLLFYLKTYCEKEEKLDRTIWYFYDCCNIPSLVRVLHPEIEIHRDVKLPEANKLMIDFITRRDLNTFLLYNIHIDSRDSSKFQIGTIGNEIFGSLSAFQSFLFSIEEDRWSYLKEYKKFFTEAIAAENKLIPFNFRIINIDERRKNNQ